MRTVAEIGALRAVLDDARSGGAIVGLVPTMGSLHDGHVSLMMRAVEECDMTVATIFVNPLQFGADEDLDAYPRDLDRDCELTQGAGVDLLFVPSIEEMYPQPVLTTVSVAGISELLEGRSRPGHFAGVATVVSKLFAIAGPCRAYFGEKDFQQLAVVRRMAGDLSFPVEVIGCPTRREPDGLAMSSRNAYLTPDERAAAPVLYRALRAGADAIAAGETDANAVEAVVADVLGGSPLAHVDYVAAVDAATLAPLDPLRGEVRLLVAAKLGRARLIDNIGATVAAAPTGRGATT